jgi:hypothetical protein
MVQCAFQWQCRVFQKELYNGIPNVRSNLGTLSDSVAYLCLAFRKCPLDYESSSLRAVPLRTDSPPPVRMA